MILVNNLKLSLDADFNYLKPTVEKLLGVKIDNVYLYRKSVDARKKNDVHYVYTVDVKVKDEKKVKIGEKIKEEKWAPYLQSVVIFGRCHLVENTAEVICLVKQFANK